MYSLYNLTLYSLTLYNVFRHAEALLLTFLTTPGQQQLKNVALMKNTETVTYLGR